MSSEETILQQREDASLTETEDAELRRLLFACFPHEPLLLKRRFLKECPAHRWLVYSAAGEMVAHSAIHDKIIGAETGDLRIGGVAEVCVSAKYRGRGLVREMLGAIHAWLPQKGIAFAVLFGMPEVYTSSGYRVIANEVRCDNSLLRKLNPWGGKPMLKCLAETPWPKGLIDLRGGTF